MKLSSYFQQRKIRLLLLYLSAVALLFLYSFLFLNQNTLSYLQELLFTPLKPSDRLDGLAHIFFNLMGLMPFLLLFAFWSNRNCYSPKFWWFFPFSFVAGAFVIEPWLIIREERFESCRDQWPDWLRWIWLGIFVFGLGGVIYTVGPSINFRLFLEVLSTNSFYQVMSLDLILFVVLIVYGLTRQAKG
jgi:hypothetical protein